MLSESFPTYAQSSISFIQQNKLSSLIVLLLPLFYYAYFDYQGWYALGPGGLPHNAFGWLVQSLLRLRASRDVRDSSCYDVAMRSSELERRRFLDGQLPDWTGEAPKTALWVAPHRQLKQVATAEIKKVRPLVLNGFMKNYGQKPYFNSLPQTLQALEATLSQIVNSNPHALELGPSQIEGGSPALFISPENFNSNHDSYSLAPREIFHSHCEAEGSSHAILSAADAMLVLDKGWGERHALSGKAFGPPLGYVMIFAPRSMRDVEIVGIVARAAARYGLEGKKVF